MTRRVVFHIGLEKTGTDSFQRFCTEQRGLLRQHATLYPTDSLAFGEHNHEPLVACYLDYRDASIQASGRPRAQVLDSLRAEIDQAGTDNILISGEHFSSRFKEAEIARLAADFADFDCRIAVVVRDHRARMLSAYSQSVLSGRDMTLDAYCDEVFDPENRYMRYAVTIGAWEQVFGQEKISLFRYAKGTDMVSVLSAALISPTLAPSFKTAYWDNLSIGPGPTEWLRRANHLVACIPGGADPTIRRALRGPRRGLARLIARICKDPGRRQELSPRNVARLNEIAAIDNAWLESRGVRLD